MTTKSYIAQNIKQRLGISLKVSTKLTDKFIYLIIKNARTSKVKISGFGSFNSHISPRRVGRNPKTNESYIINPMKKIVFKSSNKTKGMLN